MAQTLMIGSCEPFSGKSALVLGIARQLICSNYSVKTFALSQNATLVFF